MSTNRFDAVGRLAALQDSRGYSTQLKYAVDGRFSGHVDPLNLAYSVQLDVLSRRTALIQPNTAAMRQITGNATATTNFQYDGRGNQIRVTDVRAVPTTYGYDAGNRNSAESGSDIGALTYARNAAGDITSRTDARGITLNRSFDAMGRTTAITPPSGAAITYAFVPGRADALFSQMTDPSGSTVWTYDSNAQMLTKRQVALSIAREVDVVRNGLGRATSVTYPSGMRIDIGYNVDVVSSIAVNGTALLNSIAYRPLSPVATNWRWGNGSTYSRTFDNDGRVTSVSLGTVQRTYTYDPNGQVTGFTDQGPAGTKQNSFTYDEAGQLTGYSGSIGTGGYSYDANGNRLSEVINGIGRTYTYFSGTNRIASVTNEWTYAYNADGNPTTDGGFFNFTYDSYGRVLTAVSPQDVSLAYTYNGLGQRVSKTVKRWQCSGGGGSVNSGPTPVSSHASGQTTANASTSTAASLASAIVVRPQAASCSFVTTGLNQYVYDDAGHMIGEYDNVTKSWQETIWFNGQPVATMQPSGLYYISADHMGTPRSIVRASDNLEVWRWDSDPFGSTIATNPTSVALTYGLRFPGQYLDVESSTHYNGMRDYRPQTGRYLQADPIGLRAGTSRYAYVGGNPISRTDPYGLYWFRQPWQTPGVVGRPGTPVEPGGTVSSLIETRVPAGYTFGEMHDSFVDRATMAGIPDLLANVPSMPFVYGAALVTEILRSLGILEQPKPESAPCK